MAADLSFLQPTMADVLSINSLPELGPAPRVILFYRQRLLTGRMAGEVLNRTAIFTRSASARHWVSSVIGTVQQCLHLGCDWEMLPEWEIREISE